MRLKDHEAETGSLVQAIKAQRDNTQTKQKILFDGLDFDKKERESASEDFSGQAITIKNHQTELFLRGY